MKKLFLLIPLFMVPVRLQSMQARMLPAHYSNLAGRIIVAPRVQLDLVTPKEAQQMHDIQMLEREKALADYYIADERNSKLRDWQNKRAIMRIKGSNSLYQNNPPEIKSPMIPY